VLGVKVSINFIHVRPLLGRVHISNFKICNPSEKPPFTSPYLLFAKEVIVDLNIYEYLFHSTVTISELVFKGVHIIYEKPEMLSGTSNVELVREHLENEMSKPKDNDEVKESPKEKAEVKDWDWKSCCRCCLSRKRHRRAFVVNRLHIEDNEAEAKFSVKGETFSLTVPPIISKDFSKECRGTDIDDIIMAFAQKLAAGILRSVESKVEDAAKATEDRFLSSFWIVLADFKKASCIPCANPDAESIAEVFPVNNT